LAGYWDPEQMQMLANYGISLQAANGEKPFIVDFSHEKW